MSEALAFALAAGTLAAVKPCGFAMLPAYLTLFVAGGLTPGSNTAPDRAAALGVVMLTGRNVLLRTPKLRAGGNPAAGLGAMALHGVSYAIASLGCTIGPFLVVTTTTFRSGDVTTGIAAYAAYAAGMGLVVGLLAVTAALAQQTVARVLRRALPHITRIGGALLVFAGGYVAWYGIYELRVYAGGDAEDPIVGAAGSVQNLFAGWVESAGAGAFAVALGGVAVLVMLRWLVVKRRRAARAR